MLPQHVITKALLRSCDAAKDRSSVTRSWPGPSRKACAVTRPEAQLLGPVACGDGGRGSGGFRPMRSEVKAKLQISNQRREKSEASNFKSEA